ncbi:MAG: galactose mutarotase [Clostridium sp.]|nr:galactose mutarotase [Prevotella sp.]MCM1429754.1 galactose mutarotase [Clostridium sp.]MCM1474931.1 galactose mutarotase [Muribaculaceae bacterium]
MMKITVQNVKSPYGDIALYRIENASGAAVTLSALGAGIIGVQVPDRYGRLENVALAYADAVAYMADGPCMGKCPGRYANRIALGKFSLDGQDFKLAVNNGPNALHGGPTGFQNRIWQSQIIPSGVRFSYLSKDGEEGYPGNLTVIVDYSWNDNNELTLNFKATTDKPTVVNLTNHCYWNLDGADAGSVLNHTLKLNASKWLPTDDTLIPTGELAEVKDTPMDFRRFKTLGRDIREDFPALVYGKGYDNCWVIDGEEGKLKEAAVLTSDFSGRTMRVLTDQPGVQVYTGNWLVGCPDNRSGRRYFDYDGVAIECQGFPDAPNHPEFPDRRLNPGEEYRSTIRFCFC